MQKFFIAIFFSLFFILPVQADEQADRFCALVNDTMLLDQACMVDAEKKRVSLAHKFTEKQTRLSCERLQLVAQGSGIRLKDGWEVHVGSTLNKARAICVYEKNKHYYG